LITTNESTVVPEPLFDAIMVEDRQSDRRLPDPPCTDESNWSEVFGETNDLLDQVVPSETGPGRRGRRFSKESVVRT